MPPIRCRPWQACRLHQSAGRGHHARRVHQRAEHPGRARRFCIRQGMASIRRGRWPSRPPLPSAKRTRWTACPPLPSGQAVAGAPGHRAGGGLHPAHGVACIRRRAWTACPPGIHTASAPGHRAGRGHHAARVSISGQRIRRGHGLHHACPASIFPACISEYLPIYGKTAIFHEATAGHPSAGQDTRKAGRVSTTSHNDP